MNDRDLMLRNTYKSEVDEVLFHDIHFDSIMKEQVMKRIQPEIKRSKRTGGVFSQRHTKWIFGSIATTAAMAFLLFALPHLESPPTHAPPIQSATTLNTPFIADSSTLKLGNPSEAEQLYGEDLLLPSYTPALYKNESIVAYSREKGTFDKVVFTYKSEIHSYELIVKRDLSLEGLESLVKTEINGSTGYLHEDENIGSSLNWNIGNNQYMIIGKLPKEEILKIAKSIK